MIKYFKYLKSFSPKQKKFYIFLLIISIIVQLLDVVSVALIPVLVSLIISTNDGGFFLLELDIFKNFINSPENIKYFILIFILFFIFKNIFLYLSLILENNFFRDLQYDFQTKIFGNYIRKDIDFIQKKKYSTLQRNIIYAQEFSFLFQKVLKIIKEFIFLIGIIVILFLQDVYTTLAISSLLIISSLLFNFTFKKKYFEIGNQTLKKKSDFIQHLTEAINSFKLIFLYKSYNVFEDDFNKTLKSRVQLETYQKNLSSIVKPMLEILIVVFLASVILFYINLKIEINILIPILTLYTVAGLKISQSLNSISIIFSSLKYSEPLLNEVSEDISKNTITTFPKKNIIELNEKIKVKNLSFGFANSEKKLFEDLNLEIFKDQLFGVIGKSGSGKSTFIDLISGILKPDNGSILIDGKEDIKNLLSDWHQQIGYIPQESYILDNKLATNICFGLKFDQSKYDKIIKILHLEDLDQREKKSEKNIVGDKGGSNLSGGQRQRISIARALYREAKILIFDEPTSALDYKLSKSLFELLNKIKKDKVIILISHEKEFLNYYDSFIDLDK